jgi:hypothetical protein
LARMAFVTPLSRHNGVSPPKKITRLPSEQLSCARRSPCVDQPGEQPMSANIRRTALIAAFTILSMPATSFAADMIIYGRDQAPRHTTHYQPRATESAYTNRAEMRCDENVVSYRSPYERRTEVVTLCHPPLNWRTEPSTATIWSP